MLNIKLIECITSKAKDEKRIINIPTVARETGISRQVLHNWKKGDISSVNTEILEKLLAYFGFTTIDELIEYVPAETPKSEES